MPRPRQVKDLQHAEDLQRRCFFTGPYSFGKHCHMERKLQCIEITGLVVLFVEVWMIGEDRGRSGIMIGKLVILGS